ncbi:helix-turn-helix transcriptional regulator [Paenibacillus amylolyticus]|uniref:helix-turn-helix transcriptional regulator n=1 Tax=Paenibacillus amylolyticus TaxID=1451 RepID=UPI0032E3B293
MVRENAMPISRHFEIVYMLLHRKTITAGELAQHFEVSTRTIYRDIDTLSAAGIPVYSSKGKGGGISLLPGYSFNASLLSGKEKEDVLMALQMLEATAYPGIEAVLLKFVSLFKKERNNWLEVDFSPWGSGESSRFVFQKLRKAIVNHHIIHFWYYNSAGQASRRSVEPVQLIFKAKAWYLAGYCLSSKDSRIFKINRMRDIEVTDEHYEPRMEAQAIKEAEKLEGQDLVEVKLRISAKGAYRVYDEFPDPMITANSDGSYTVRGEFSIGLWLDSYLLSFGTLLEEISPESLRNRLLSQLSILKNRLE